MRRIIVTLGVVVLLLGLAVSPARAKVVSTPVHKSAFTVGLVTDIGGLNDKSFNHLAYVGLQTAETQYHVVGRVIESHSQADYVPNLTNFASHHYGLTIAVGFLMEAAIYQVAKQYPNQKFAIIDGQPADPKGNLVVLRNVANLYFREQQSGFLVGVIAGLMERNKIGVAVHNTIGVMGGLSIPSVNRYIAGYFQGARKVDPTIRILLAYSQTFTNPGPAKNIGNAQISRGADILFQVSGLAGLGYLSAAQQHGKYGIGVDADQSALGTYIITSAVKKVDAAVAITAHQAQTGRFQAGNHEFDLKNNATGFAKTSRFVPLNIARQANLWQTLIKSGRVVPTTIIHP